MSAFSKGLLAAAVIGSVLTVSARPGNGYRGGRGPAPRPSYHHGHHGRHSGGFAAGVVGGAILGGLVYEALRPEPAVVVSPAPVVVSPAPVVVSPAPVVVQPAPVVVQPAPVVVQPAPVVVQQPQPVVTTQNVWVDGRYVDRVQANGAVLRVWEPGHYEQRQVTVYR